MDEQQALAEILRTEDVSRLDLATDLTGAYLVDADFHDCRFTRLIATGATFAGKTIFDGAQFAGETVLDGAVFEGATAAGGSATPRPDVRLVQYRLYAEVGGRVVSDGRLHECVLRSDVGSG